MIARVAAKDPINFAVHRKGCGVLCNAKKGIPNDTMVVDFLGELYPPWRWHEKQDAVKDVQRRQWQDEHLPESTEFYNMQLERPKGDGKGYGLLFVDAMHRTNYSARLAHSCSPNVEVRVKATGMLLFLSSCIFFYQRFNSIFPCAQAGSTESTFTRCDMSSQVKSYATTTIR